MGARGRGGRGSQRERKRPGRRAMPGWRSLRALALATRDEAPPGDCPEDLFQAKVELLLDELSTQGDCSWYHDRDPVRNRAGFPDLVIVLPGRGVLWRELKTARGRLSREQQVWLAQLQAAGQDAKVWRPADWDEIVTTLAASPTGTGWPIGSYDSQSESPGPTRHDKGEAGDGVTTRPTRRQASPAPRERQRETRKGRQTTRNPPLSQAARVVYQT